MTINRLTGFAQHHPVRFGQFKIQCKNLSEEEKKAVKALFPGKSAEKVRAENLMVAYVEKFHQFLAESMKDGNFLSSLLRQDQQAASKALDCCRRKGIPLSAIPEIVEELGLMSAARVKEARKYVLNPEEQCEKALARLERRLSACFPGKPPILRFEKFGDDCIRIAAVDKDGRDLQIIDLPGRARSIPGNDKLLLYNINEENPNPIEVDLRNGLTNFAEGLTQGINREFPALPGRHVPVLLSSTPSSPD
jgi:hypothetical protein